MKRYAIGLITGALLAISAMMFLGAQYKDLGHITADTITASSIKLVSEKGETFIVGGGLFTQNADGKFAVALQLGQGGSGYISIFNADGKETVYK